MLAPDAESDVELPGQTDVFADAVIDGSDLIVTGTVFVFTQPFAVEVTVYVVFDDGDATTLAPVVVFKPADGLHE